MTNKPIAIVLGGTNPHIELINNLKARGYYTILLDYLENPPAKIFADEHIRASTLNHIEVLEISKRIKAALVISTCIDQANSVCCYVAEKLGLPHPYSYKTSLEVTNKSLMKKIMTDNEIPTSSFQTICNIDEIDWHKVSFPSVVKPVDCNSSKGVKRVDTVDETREYVKEAIKLSRTQNAIIEGFNQGVEIQVDCIATVNGVKVMMTRQKQKISTSSNEMVLQSFGSIFPAPLTYEQNKQVRLIAQRIAKSFNLNNTPFFYQAIVTDNGIQVLELAPRIGGGLSYYVLKEFGNFDAVDYAIDSYLGKTILIEPKMQNSFISTYLIYMKAGVFDRVEGLEEQRESGLIKEIFMFINSGSTIDSDLRSSNRVAAFIVEGESYEQIRNKARKALENIYVRNAKGEDLLNRELYLSL